MLANLFVCVNPCKDVFLLGFGSLQAISFDSVRKVVVVREKTPALLGLNITS